MAGRGRPPGIPEASLRRYRFEIIIRIRVAARRRPGPWTAVAGPGTAALVRGKFIPGELFRTKVRAIAHGISAGAGEARGVHRRVPVPRVDSKAAGAVRGMNPRRRVVAALIS